MHAFRFLIEDSPPAKFVFSKPRYLIEGIISSNRLITCIGKCHRKRCIWEHELISTILCECSFAAYAPENRKDEYRDEDQYPLHTKAKGT